MARTDASTKSLLNGVSTKHPYQQAPGFADIQTNFRSSIRHGLTRRQGTEWTELSQDVPLTGSEKIHYAMHDGVGHYIIIDPTADSEVAGGIRVIREDGEVLTTDSVEPVWDYIAGANTDNLRLATYKDRSYICNSEQTVGKTGTTLQRQEVCYWECRAIGVTDDQFVCTITPAGGLPRKDYPVTQLADDESITDIARRMGELISADVDGVQTYVDVIGNTVRIFNDDQQPPPSMAGSGPQLNTVSVVSNGVTDSPTRLPYSAQIGDIVEIRPGNVADGDNSYYLEASGGSDGTNFEGVTWRESTPDWQQRDYNADTMPHEIVIQSDGNFRLQKVAWASRSAGNDNNNPFNLHQETISDIAITQNRLVLVSGTEVAMSVTNKLNNLFIQSIAQGVPTDAIHIGSNDVGGVPLEYAVPHKESIYFFSERSQFVIDGSQPITPDTATLVKTSGYPFRSSVRPVSSGVDMYFPFSYGEYAGINRLSIADGRDSLATALPVTDNVSQYIRGDIRYITIDATLGVGAYIADGDTNAVFLNEFFLDPNDSLQLSSWSRMDFGEDYNILACELNKASLELLTIVEGSAALLKMPLNPPTLDTLFENIYLDNKDTYTNVNTTIDLGDDYPDVGIEEGLMIVQGEGCPEPGDIVTFTYDSEERQIILDLDMDGGQVVIGWKFLSTYQPAEILVRDEGGRPQSNAKLRIVNWTLTTEFSGEITTEIISDFYNFPPQKFYGIIGRDIESQFNDPNLGPQQIVIPFKQDSRLAKLRISTDDWTPMDIVGLEWSGGYNKRGRRF